MTLCPRRPILVTVLMVLWWLIGLPGPAQGADRTFPPGMPLPQALRQLEREGLALVYSSQIITSDLKVKEPVNARTPRAQLEELLSPHGLTARLGPGGVLIVVAGPSGPKPQPLPAPAEPPQWTVADKILVQPHVLSLVGDDPPPPLTLRQNEIQSHARVADDIFRTLDVLPGVASGDVSAEIHIRGARRDEMLVLLDGQELYNPYHLREFDNPFSIIDSSALERASLLTGAFPVNYGHRVAGVLDMTTIAASQDRRITVSASVVGAQIEASDSHADGRLGWFFSSRRGTTDLIGRLLDVEDPRFWDLFGKARYELTPSQSTGIHVLMARDSLHHIDRERIRRIDTDYDSSYLWLSHQSIVSRDLYFNTIASSSLLEQRRAGFEHDELRAYEVTDDRRFDVIGVSQSWGWQTDDRNLLSFGLEYQKLKTRYDYASSRAAFRYLMGDRARSFTLDDVFRTENTSIYVSDRFHPVDRLTLDLGLRYDSQTSRDGDTLSPRISAAWAAGPSDIVRLAWGRYSQSQRPYELMVEDGDATPYPAEESEQWALGYERTLSPASWLPVHSIKVDAYVRHSSSPRPRYEYLFGSYHPFPEGEAFRVRIEPESATARGIELLVGGRAAARWRWWLNYALADTTDKIDGAKVARRVDQTHSLNVDVTYRPSARWSVNLAWLHHTGWPITDVVLADVGDELVPVVGPLNETRLKDYNRIDLRVSRQFAVRGGVLTLFADAQNVLNSRNQAGIELRIGNESGKLEIRKERWPGTLGSAGVVWRFGGFKAD